MQLKKGLKILAELGDKKLFWSDDLEPILIPRIPGTANSRRVQMVCVCSRTLQQRLLVILHHYF